MMHSTQPGLTYKGSVLNILGHLVRFLLLDNWLFTVTGIIFLIYAISIPVFLSGGNLENIFMGASLTGIATAGFTIALLAGQIDASTLGVVAVSANVAAVSFQTMGLPFPVVILLTLGVAALMGLLNSLLIIEGRIFSLIATMATSGVFIGLSLFITGGTALSIGRDGFSEVLLARPLGVPVAIWLLALTYTVAYIVLNYTKLGMHIYATGSNYQAARLAGVDVKNILRLCMVTVSMLIAVVAMLAMARVRTSLMFGVTPSAVNFGDVVIAALLGGVSLYGGIGRIQGALIAVLFLAILTNGLLLLSLPPAVAALIKGAIFMITIIVDAQRHPK
jgi:ribose/xylose/arabinose/galactoside ABC-type transport system permease subunit